MVFQTREKKDQVIGKWVYHRCACGGTTPRSLDKVGYYTYCDHCHKPVRIDLDSDGIPVVATII